MRKERNAAYYASEDESQSRLRIMGVWFEDQYRRVYPYGSAACSVIGFPVRTARWERAGSSSFTMKI